MSKPTPEQTETRELVKAVTLFVENYRTMHANTSHTPQVNRAADKVNEALMGVMRETLGVSDDPPKKDEITIPWITETHER